MTASPKPTALEFFAGGGLARLGLQETFDTIWANDFEPLKAKAWTDNFGTKGFTHADIHTLAPASLPTADLAWASFPCQDLSLAGDRGGLSAKRSGSFFAFIAIIDALKASKRAPHLIVIENVSGLLTSHQGRDFAAIIQALADLGYRAGALEIDARHFLPQSRPRVFIVAVAGTLVVPPSLLAKDGGTIFHTPAIQKAVSRLTEPLAAQHAWWSLPEPPPMTATLLDLIDRSDTRFWPQAKTQALLDSLSDRHKRMLQTKQQSGAPCVGAIYRRTRTSGAIKRAYAEVRFDGLAGCLRTPSGGSSRQFLLFVEGDDLRVRPLNAREAMALMGVSYDSYKLPKSQLGGLKIAGDGVAVPVVAWLTRHLLAPLAAL